MPRQIETAGSVAQKVLDTGLIDELWPGLESEESHEGTSTASTGDDQPTKEGVQSQPSEDETVDYGDDAGEPMEGESVGDGREQDASMEEGVQEASSDSEGALTEPLTVEEFAQAFDMPGADKVRIKTKVNGEDGDIGLDELVQSYNKDSAIQSKAFRQANDEKQRIEQWTQRQNELTQGINALYGIAGELRKKVEERYDPQEMARLKEEDPGLYSAKQLEKAGDLEAFDNLLAQAQSQVAMAQQQGADVIRQRQEETQKAIFGTGEDRQDAIIPEWHDQKVYLEESQDIRNYLGSIGYSPEEVTFTDPRLVVLVRDASKYRQMLQSRDERVKEVKKKVKTLPKAKIARPGAKATKSSSQKRPSKEETIERLKGARSVRDASQILSQHLPDEFFQ